MPRIFPVKNTKVQKIVMLSVTVFALLMFVAIDLLGSYDQTSPLIFVIAIFTLIVAVLGTISVLIWLIGTKKR